jgi:hypothetical protein
MGYFSALMGWVGSGSPPATVEITPWGGTKTVTNGTFSFIVPVVGGDCGEAPNDVWFKFNGVNGVNFGIACDPCFKK